MHFSRKDALRIGEILSQAAITEIMPRFQMLAADQVQTEIVEL